MLKVLLFKKKKLRQVAHTTWREGEVNVCVILRVTLGDMEGKLVSDYTNLRRQLSLGSRTSVRHIASE